MKAKLLVNKNFQIGEIDKRLYGSFIEHLGRAVYDGIYEPTHPTADEEGFRQDVIDLVKKLNVPIVRYPGGNFVSGYDWKDGIGDKSQRPTKIDLSWEALETNEVGIDDFQSWAKKADSEVMMAVNLGTKGIEDAVNCVEYCNFDADSYWANKRKENGYEKPFNIKTWCLGNEMDAKWQIGYKTAKEYARLAHVTARAMKQVDPSIEIVACGSSSFTMKTFGEWEYEVLDECYNDIEYVSLHTYYGNQANDTPRFFAYSELMDAYIKGVIATCDAVKAKYHSNKTINISFDEWNVWANTGGEKFTKWKKAEHRLEQIYTFEDALVVGCMLMTLQNNSDRVKMACLAQLVNVIAAIITETGGKAWAQSIFYPFMYASNYGCGVCMKTILQSDKYNVAGMGDIDYIKTSVIHNEKEREIICFAVNRSLEDNMDFEINFEDFGDCKIVEHIELYSDDLKCTNSAEVEDVKPNNISVNDTFGTKKNITLKKHSWNMIKIKY